MELWQFIDFSTQYVGSVESNFWGTNFKVFDYGVCGGLDGRRDGVPEQDPHDEVVGGSILNPLKSEMIRN